MNIEQCLVFDGEQPLRSTSAARVAVVPRGISTKDALLRALATGLDFPDYFGHNWDSLEECLKDLSWVSQPDVWIVHADLPALAKSDLKLYVDILCSAALSWREGEAHRLRAVFPRETQDELIALATAP